MLSRESEPEGFSKPGADDQSSVTPLIKYIYVLCAVFHHPESVPYAFELLNGTELFGQRIRLQNKATGLGESC